MNILRKLTSKVSLKTFGFWEKFGLHLTPDHFYSPIPSTADLPDTVFSRRSDCVGLDWNDDKQRWYLETVYPQFVKEKTFDKNPGLSLVDAAVLHSMIRYHKPKKLIEVGSGASTDIISTACAMNEREGYPCHFVSIDPYPTLPSLTRNRLIQKRVQDVDVAEFIDCDLLFIDSSHVVKIGGDVNYEILEILPRLKDGCLIHFHDILLPGEYWKEWVINHHLIWSEQYLLQAFLLFNHAFEVLWGSRYMHLSNPNRISSVFPFFESSKHHITSFWIQKKLPANNNAIEGRFKS